MQQPKTFNPGLRLNLTEHSTSKKHLTIEIDQNLELQLIIFSPSL
jgi:hypothetical protein